MEKKMLVTSVVGIVFVLLVCTVLSCVVSVSALGYTDALPEEVVGVDFIDELDPYVKEPYDIYRPIKSSEGLTVILAGKTYDHWIQNMTNCGGYYALDGQYSTLTFESFCEFDTVLYFYGDDGVLLDSCYVRANELPLKYSVDVTGVDNLLICGSNYGVGSGLGLVYILNAEIQ